MSLLMLMMACAGDDTVEPVNLVEDFPAPPAGGEQWLSPVLEIPAYTDAMMCTVYTYEGDDVGVNSVETYQSDHGHHTLLLRTELDDDDHPDGETFDCTEAESLDMTSTAPIIISGDGIAGEAFSLPDGMASNFERGDRVLVQSHYINPTDTPILVQDAINLGYLPEDEVEIWASFYSHVLLDHPIPGGNVETTHTITCEWEEDLNLLFLGGHMHEWGEHIAIDMTRDDQVSRLYEVEQWLPEHRDDPPVSDYSVEPFQVLAGDTFTTSCTWFNDTDEELNFPNEMCANFGMMYPQKTPIICDGEE